VFIGGGNHNYIRTSSNYSNIVGGSFNLITSGATYGFIGGGTGNQIDNDIIASSIIGGSGNTISHDHAHIIGTNLTSVSANTTHVEKLNIGTLDGGTPLTPIALSSNGMVVDGSSLQVKEATLFIASGDVITLNTVPLQIIPAPGVGKSIEVLGAMSRIYYSGNTYTRFDSQAVLNIKHTGATDNLYGHTNTSSILDSTVSRILQMSRSSSTPIGAGDTQILENEPVHVTIANGNPSGGNSPIKVYVTYKEITL
jgi:hypothetical protein